MGNSEFLKFSEYNSSILNDEATSAILAWIERSGMTSEDEIIDETGISKSDLSQILLRLYKNKFVSFGPNTVQVTSFGKTLLHTLGYDADIIESALDDFKFDFNTKRDLTLVLNYSRNKHYEEYLKTIFDLKIWKLLTLEIDEKLNPKTKVGFDQIGALSHVRHLCIRLNYTKSYDFTIDFPTVNNLSQCLLISHGESDKPKKLDKRKEQPALNEIFAWTNKVYEAPSKLDKMKFETQFEYFFSLYTTIRHNYDQNSWYLKWFDLSQKIKKKTETVERLHKYFISHREFYKPTRFETPTFIRNNTSELKSVIEVLEILRNCSNYLELSEKLNISEHEAIGLITNYTTELNRLI